MAEKKETLAFVAKKLSGAKINWALIGSANLELQGMDVVPNDIDILVDFSDKEKIEKLFMGEKIVSNSIQKNGEAEEITYLIDGVDVQICYEHPHGFYFQFFENNRFEKTMLGSVEILCNRLEDEALAYEHLGRKEKAERSREFIGK